MLFRSKILDIISKYYASGMRVIKAERFSGDNHNMLQHHTGGEDYNPPTNVIPICMPINGNDGEMAIIGYTDGIVRTSEQGERLMYATDEAGTFVTSSIKLTNLGEIIAYALTDIYLNAVRNIFISAIIDITLTCTNLLISATNVTVTSNLFSFTGTIEGTDVKDDSGSTPSMQDMRDLFNMHTHGGGSTPDQAQ